jgi:hypothetical protein
MPQFAYKALQPDGSLVEGTIDAGGRQEAMRQIEGRGLKPIRLTEPTGCGATGQRRRPLACPRFHAVSSLESPGIGPHHAPDAGELHAPAVQPARGRRALQPGPGHHCIARRRARGENEVEGNPRSRDRRHVALERRWPARRRRFPACTSPWSRPGRPAASSMSCSPRSRIFQAREKELQSKVLAALMYPAVLLVLAVAVLIFLLVFFIPRFQLVFKGFNAELPLITQVIVGASEVIRSYGLIVAVVAGVVLFALRGWLGSDRAAAPGRAGILRPRSSVRCSPNSRWRDSAACWARCSAPGCRSSALNVARRSIGNQILVDAVGLDRTRQGGQGPRHEPRQNRALFPGAIVEMISVAEEAANSIRSCCASPRHRRRSRPAAQDSGGARRTGDALPHRGLRRHDLHRHGHSHLLPAGPHQMIPSP